MFITPCTSQKWLTVVIWLTWTTMDCHGLSWIVMDCHGLSWTILDQNQLWLDYNDQLLSYRRTLLDVKLLLQLKSVVQQLWIVHTYKINCHINSIRKRKAPVANLTFFLQTDYLEDLWCVGEEIRFYRECKLQGYQHKAHSLAILGLEVQFIFELD